MMKLMVQLSMIKIKKLNNFVIVDVSTFYLLRSLHQETIKIIQNLQL